MKLSELAQRNVGGRKGTRRRLRKKFLTSPFSRFAATVIFGPDGHANAMRSLGYWKSNGPRRPLWRAEK